MRVSRRLSGFYKPALLIGSLLAIIYLVNDSTADVDKTANVSFKLLKSKIYIYLSVIYQI